MKNIIKKHQVTKGLLAIVAAAALASCKPNFNEMIPSNGQADFSRYIAVGNSLTAGYADGGLYLESQQNSIPEIIAKQMKTAGGGDFNSPFFSEAQANGTGYGQLSGFTATGSPIITPVTSNTVSPRNFTKYEGAFNNYGVPEIKLLNLETKNYASANPFFARMLGNSPASSSYLDVVSAQNFTFFSFWEGHTDILGFAYTGGSQPLTSVTEFRRLYNLAITRLTAKEAKGVVGTVGDILAIPYFNVVTLKALQAGVASVAPNATFYIKTAAGPVVAADSTIKFTLPLSSANLIGRPDGAGRPYGLHPGNPIANNFVIDKAEQVTITNTVNAYNAIIKEVATAKGLAIVDVDDFMIQFYKPKMVNGAAISTAFITGNLFSLDGIHLTPIGNAITANAFIKAINQKYGSSLPIVNIAHYRGVKFPAGAPAAAPTPQ